MNNKIYIQEFKIKDGMLHIISTNGGNYEISKTSCSCKGFGFRSTCGHYKEAKEKDLLSLLDKHQVKKPLTMSITAIKMRKDAIRKFLTKHSISFEDTLIEKLESKLNSTTKLEDFIKMAKNL